MPSSLRQVIHSALSANLQALGEDLTRLELRGRHQVAEAIGTRAGGWVYEVLLALLNQPTDSPSVPHDEGDIIHDSSGFFDEEYSSWHGQSASGTDWQLSQGSSHVLQNTLAPTSAGGSLLTQILLSWLPWVWDSFPRGWSSLCGPASGLIVAWLLDRVSTCSQPSPDENSIFDS